MIEPDFYKSLKWIKERTAQRWGITSLPADPIHPGHIKMLDDCRNFCDSLVIIVNSDRFLRAKKGYCLIPLTDRMSVVDSCAPKIREGNIVVTTFDDGKQGIAGALKHYRFWAFLKGGDRNCSEMDRTEVEACISMGTRLIHGVGGYTKHASSSEYFTQAYGEYSKYLKWADQVNSMHNL